MKKLIEKFQSKSAGIFDYFDRMFGRPRGQGAVTTRSPRRVGFALVLLCAFLILEAILLAHHEMWRDELGEWVFAKESASLQSLIRNYPYLEHPMLWQILLYFPTRITPDPGAMQFIHLLIAGAIVYIFSRYSPFTKIQKVLFCFGYYPFYEYAAISRQYSLGVLLLFIFCAIYSKRRKNLIIMGVLLFLLANTHVVGLIISIVITLMLFFDLYGPDMSGNWMRSRPAAAPIAILIAVAGITLSILQQSRTISAEDIISRISLCRTTEGISCIYYGFFPLFHPIRHFWVSNLLFNPPYPPIETGPTIIKLILSFLVTAIACGLLARRRNALFLFAASTLFMVAFFSVYQSGTYRHNGFFPIVFFAALWIATKCPDREIRSRKLAHINLLAEKVKLPFLYGILILHLAMSVFAVRMELLYPFSCAKAAARFIGNLSPKPSLISGYPNWAIYPVATFLNVELGEAYWDEYRIPTKRTTIEEVLEKFSGSVQTSGGSNVFLSINPIEERLLRRFGLVRLASFSGAIAPKEDYYIYSVRR